MSNRRDREPQSHAGLVLGQEDDKEEKKISIGKRRKKLSSMEGEEPVEQNYMAQCESHESKHSGTDVASTMPKSKDGRPEDREEVQLAEAEKDDQKGRVLAVEGIDYLAESPRCIRTKVPTHGTFGARIGRLHGGT